MKVVGSNTQTVTVKLSNRELLMIAGALWNMGNTPKEALPLSEEFMSLFYALQRSVLDERIIPGKKKKKGAKRG
jgi:hypothetical protein